MKQMIMNRMAVMCVAMSALALSFLLVGATARSPTPRAAASAATALLNRKEKTVTQSKDGTVTKTEESKKTTPPEKP